MIFKLRDFILFIVHRSTLTDPAFVNVLLDNDFIVWGGDIRDKAAWDGGLH